MVVNEGCLSFPGQFYPVERTEQIKIRYLSPGGKIKSQYMNGFTARVFQHELDHLNGIVFIDRAFEQNYITEEEYRRTQL